MEKHLESITSKRQVSVRKLKHMSASRQEPGTVVECPSQKEVLNRAENLQVSPVAEVTEGCSLLVSGLGRKESRISEFFERLNSAVETGLAQHAETE
jgi:hypothetical protein